MARLDNSRALTWAVACCGTVLAVCAGCGGGAGGLKEEAVLGAQEYRRMRGSTTRIYVAAKRTFDALGAQITEERTNRAISAKMGVGGKEVFVYLKIVGGDHVYLRFYNLTEKEEDEWRRRLYDEIEDTLAGVPREKRRRGQSS